MSEYWKIAEAMGISFEKAEEGFHRLAKGSLKDFGPDDPLILSKFLEALQQEDIRELNSKANDEFVNRLNETTATINNTIDDATTKAIAKVGGCTRILVEENKKQIERFVAKIDEARQVNDRAMEQAVETCEQIRLQSTKIISDTLNASKQLREQTRDELAREVAPEIIAAAGPNLVKAVELIAGNKFRSEYKTGIAKLVGAFAFVAAIAGGTGYVVSERITRADTSYVEAHVDPAWRTLIENNNADQVMTQFCAPGSPNIRFTATGETCNTVINLRRADRPLALPGLSLTPGLVLDEAAAMLVTHLTVWGILGFGILIGLFLMAAFQGIIANKD